MVLDGVNKASVKNNTCILEEIGCNYASTAYGLLAWFDDLLQ